MTTQTQTEEVVTETQVSGSEALMLHDSILKQTARLANSTSDVVLKYILMAVLTMFGIMFWFQWRQNSAQPDRLIELIQKSVDQNTASLKVQEASLNSIREFSIRVPMEHQDQSNKLLAVATALTTVKQEQDALRSAVTANTEAVTKLVRVLESKVGREGGT